MAFCTLAEFKAYVGTQVSTPGGYEQITDLNKAITADDAVGQRLIDEGGAWLKQKFAVRYAVTEAAVAADATLAVWFREANCLRSMWYGIGRHLKLAIPKGVQTLYNELVATIEAIIAGEQALPGDTELPASTTSNAKPQAIGEEKVMSKTRLEGIW